MRCAVLCAVLHRTALTERRRRERRTDRAVCVLERCNICAARTIICGEIIREGPAIKDGRALAAALVACLRERKMPAGDSGIRVDVIRLPGLQDEGFTRLICITAR